MGSALILDSEHPSVITQDEKLDYIGTRLKKHELHAFMNLANEISSCHNLSKNEVEDLFDTFQHILITKYKHKLDTKWTQCPIKREEDF